MTEEMHGQDEAAYLSAIKLHVTGNLTLIRAAEEELVKNKVPILLLRSARCLSHHKTMEQESCLSLERI